jgi:UDP:flavonoid glycosyltransferase YjiC (YdhE family)
MGENAARVAWAGVGVRLPRRLVTARGVRLAVRRALARRDVRVRAERVAAWSATHDGRERAAGELEAWVAAWHPRPPGRRDQCSP